MACSACRPNRGCHAARPGFESSATWEMAEIGQGLGPWSGFRRQSRGGFLDRVLRTGHYGKSKKSFGRVDRNWLTTACAVEMQLWQPCWMAFYLPGWLAAGESRAGEARVLVISADPGR
jgi:hypothetical protein